MTQNTNEFDAVPTPLPMLEKRRIETSIIKHVFDVLEECYCREEAEKVIEQVVRKSAIEQGEEFRKIHNSETSSSETDLDDFAKLSDLWEMDGVLEKEVHVTRRDRLEYGMVHCAYAKMYREKTIMQGVCWI